MEKSELLKLGLQATKTEGWEWMVGMSYHPGQPYSVDTVWRILDEEELKHLSYDEVPILTDPATKGCLLHLVRKFHDMPRAWVVYREDLDKWEVCWSGSTHGGTLGSGDTELEALIDALEEK